MYNIAWDDSIEIGFPTVDEDHRKLVGLLNELFAACFAAQGPAVLTRIVDELVDYTKYHFEREENFLAEAGYAGLEDHMAQHRKMIAEVEGIREKLGTGATHDLSNKTLKFLSEWLTDQIRSEDKEFGALLRGT